MGLGWRALLFSFFVLTASLFKASLTSLRYRQKLTEEMKAQARGQK